MAREDSAFLPRVYLSSAGKEHQLTITIISECSLPAVLEQAEKAVGYSKLCMIEDMAAGIQEERNHSLRSLTVTASAQPALVEVLTMGEIVVCSTLQILPKLCNDFF